ncbi:bacteriohemerythrin [Ramlibacter sp.]|uniref:bacteriohemerythrin n=1 Tax=Ramlibacter sp. TaxID=1917967 RepID=UPI0035B3DE86
MAWMEWSDALALGLDGVDAQHRWLVEATNQLHEALADPGIGRETVGRTLDGLMDYTMNHFIMEEDLFQRHGYPERERHTALHDQFTAAVMSVINRFEDGEEVGAEVLALLKDWLVQHILHVDRAYAPFFKERGIAA